MNDHEPSALRDTGFWSSRLRRGVVLLLLTVAVVCGVIAGGLLWDAGAGTDRERAEHLHRVRATTTAAAAVTALEAWRGARSESVAAAVWEYPADVHRSGTVGVPPRTPRGRTVAIWVDDAGVPTRPPRTTGELALTSVAGGITAAGVVAASGMGVVYLGRRRAEGRRLAAWEREWEQVEPVWTGRLRRGSGPGSGDG